MRLGIAAAAFVLIAAEAVEGKGPIGNAASSGPAAQATGQSGKPPARGVSDEERQKIEQAIPTRAPAEPAKPRRLLIFDRNVNYGGHRSIPHANLAFALMGTRTGAFEAVVKHKPAAFEAEHLKQYDAVFFNNTVGNLFEDEHLRRNLAEFVEQGGGLMGVHASTTAFTVWPGAKEDWPAFGEMLGARGASHRINTEEVVVKVEDPDHPVVRVFGGKRFTFRDEFFRFKAPYSREKVRVLLSFDTEKTDMNQGRAFGNCVREDGDYPVAWVRQHGKGRVFYCTIGHNPYVFWDPTLLKFYLAATQFVLGDLPGSTRPSEGGLLAEGAISAADAQTSAPRQVAQDRAEWPCWRGPNRDGRSPDTGLLKQWPEDGPPLLWKTQGIGHGYSTVSIGWGTIYTTGDVDGKLRLFAFELDGKPRWHVDHDRAWADPVPGARATPTLHDGRLYLMSGHGLVVCRDARDGKVLWKRRMDEFGGKIPRWGYSESVLIHDGKAIITPGGRQCIVALDANTGTTVWASQGVDAPAEYGSCIVVRRPDVTMLVGVTQPGLAAVRADNGQRLWTNDYSRGGGVNVPTPLFEDGHLFWPNGFDKGAVCLRLGDDGMPSVAWTTEKDRECHLGDFIIDRGHLYGHLGGRWKCMDLKTGDVKWAAKGVGNGSVCWADGMLYLFSESGGTAGLAVCTPEGFEPRGRFRVAGHGRSWAHPVVTGGRLYLRYDTTLYCFDLSPQSSPGFR